MADTFQKWDELKLSTDTYMKLWAIYVTWFNWFFGINVASMAYVVATKDNIQSILVYPLCIFMSVCVLIGIATSMLMTNYCGKVRNHANEISDKVNIDFNHKTNSNVVTANPMMYVASWLIMASLTWTLLAWIFIALWAGGHFPFPIPKPGIAA
ncbi:MULTISPECIES: hypothetical protein [Methylobacterium]|uniref:hypothetical protein n=1 Tax=Methylobacterium TaxID=407 RepID=UPI002F3603CF